jgi:hypothetical protein
MFGMALPPELLFVLLILTLVGSVREADYEFDLYHDKDRSHDKLTVPFELLSSSATAWRSAPFPSLIS